MPILLYGSEIWGMQMDLQIENAHLFALKKQKQKQILNVSPIPKHQTIWYTGKLEEHHYIWMLRLAQYVSGLDL